MCCGHCRRTNTGGRSKWSKPRRRFSFLKKERRAIRFTQQTVDERIRHYVEKGDAQRAPWFTARVKAITWCTDVVFEQRLANQFGRGRCWLAGDAAHQTGPVGVQSMNVGLSEAAALAGCLQKLLRENASPNLLQTYNQARQDEWRRLLGLTGGLKTRSGASAWVGERRARLLPCLPGVGEDITRLASQLGLGF